MARDYVRVSKNQIREFDCPKCGAVPGEQCREGDGHREASHRERMTVAQVALDPNQPKPPAAPDPEVAAALEDAALTPTPKPAGPKPAFTPTDEQVTAVDLAVGGRMLAVEALAGTGKTSTLKLIAEAKPENGLYIAFNKAIVEEAKTKFPSRVNCATSHSLAFRQVGRRYSHRLNGRRLKSRDIARRLGVKPMPVETPMGLKMLSADFIAGMVMRGVRQFCMTADAEISPKHIPTPNTMRDDPELRRAFAEVRYQLAPELAIAWRDVADLNGELPFDHNAYLKLWQLEDPFISTDYIMFDEAQDANGVTLAIVEAQADHAQLIFVGDRYQQIYGWNGAVNAMEVVPAEDRAWLTRSFRFGPEIAEAANEVLALLGAEVKVEGAGRPGIRGECEQPSIVLARTNAGAVTEALDEIERGGRPHVIGGADDVVGFAEAADKLQREGYTSHPDLICFSSWHEVEAYAKNDELGSDLKLLVSMCNDFGALELASMLRNQPAESKATLILSTAHKAKGREWPSVKLQAGLSAAGEEERRLRYVATTRAIEHLDDVAVVAALADKDADRWDDELAELGPLLPSERAAVMMTPDPVGVVVGSGGAGDPYRVVDPATGEVLDGGVVAGPYTEQGALSLFDATTGALAHEDFSDQSDPELQAALAATNYSIEEMLADPDIAALMDDIAADEAARSGEGAAESPVLAPEAVPWPTEPLAILQRLAGDGCESFTRKGEPWLPALVGTDGACMASGRSPDAEYGADQACWPCVIHAVVSGAWPKEDPNG